MIIDILAIKSTGDNYGYPFDNRRQVSGGGGCGANNNPVNTIHPSNVNLSTATGARGISKRIKVNAWNNVKHIEMKTLPKAWYQVII